jgi:hypothetical protein
MRDVSKNVIASAMAAIAHDVCRQEETEQTKTTAGLQQADLYR